MMSPEAWPSKTVFPGAPTTPGAAPVLSVRPGAGSEADLGAQPSYRPTPSPIAARVSTSASSTGVESIG